MNYTESFRKNGNKDITLYKAKAVKATFANEFFFLIFFPFAIAGNRDSITNY